MLATAATGLDRQRIFTRLKARNRLVAILRIGVPVLGLLLLLAILLQIFVAGLARQYGISGISIDRDNLVVDTPYYSGTTEDGRRYSVGAESARAALDKPEAIVLVKMRLSFEQPGGGDLVATSDSALLDTNTLLLSVDGITTFDGKDGLHGTIAAMRADFTTQDMAGGTTDFAMPDGSRVLAESVTRNFKAGTWTFTRSDISLVSTPGDPK